MFSCVSVVRKHTLCDFHLYKVLEQLKLIYHRKKKKKTQRSGCSRGEVGTEVERKGRELSGAMVTFCVSIGL